MGAIKKSITAQTHGLGWMKRMRDGLKSYFCSRSGGE